MRRLRHAGFTLVEVLVALVVSALALTILSGFLLHTTRLDGEMAERRRLMRSTDGLFRLLENLLQGVEQEMLPLAGLPLLAVSGSGSELTIWSRGIDALALNNSIPFSIQFDNDKGIPSGGRVLIRWQSGNSIDQEEVFENVRSLSFAYAGRHADKIVWESSWQGPVRGLAMVKASIVAGRGGEILERTFSVATTLPQACVLDPLKEGCPSWR